jgi:hypothetical protein
LVAADPRADVAREVLLAELAVAQAVEPAFGLAFDDRRDRGAQLRVKSRLVVGLSLVPLPNDLPK